ncbi:MAG: prolyl oligopeptidase family serine peptidase [bacterium]|nr:prolyl oligopeptidase family serine peptidase [bacterium]
MKTMKTIVIILLFAGCLFPVEYAYAQDASGKKAMKIEDYGRWRSIRSTAISDNGNWVTFAYRTPHSNDTLYVKNLTTGKEYDIPRGSRPQFSDDSKWAAYTVSVPFKEAEKLRKDRKPIPQKAELMDLETGEKFSYDNVASYDFAKGSGHFMLKKTKSDPKAKYKGTDVILRNLNSGYQEHLGSVNECSFNKKGDLLAYTVDAADKTGNGLYVIYLTANIRKPLDNDEKEYSRLTWDEDGNALAVIKGKKDKKKVNRDNELLAFKAFAGEGPEKYEYDPSSAFDFPKDMVISERGTLSWSTDLTKVFFGIKEQKPEVEKQKDAPPLANVDIWHWKDDRLQSVQILRANRDRNYTYTSVYNLESKRFLRLTDKMMKNIGLTRDGVWGIGNDGRAYISDWKERQADYYRVNTSTGERTLMFKGQKRTLGISPDSKNFLYWKDGHVWVYKIGSGETQNLTENAPVSFVDMEFDHPGTKPPYGIAGYTKDEKNVILNHKYDLWLQPLDGGTAVNLTKGEGDNNEIRFDYIQFDREERFIDMSKPVYISAFGQWTKKAGYYVLDGGRFEQKIFEDKRFGRLTKAKNAENFLFTVETFRDFPNYYVSDNSFSGLRMITDANPWQSRYSWGRRILIEYTNKDGVRLQATLGIPDSYKEGQKLPMLVQFYEKYSQNLHRYEQPVYRDTPMLAKYCSNGYLVMQPDVHFNTGTTHSDMLDCVEAAVSKVVELGYADPDRVGLHGHSFSGQGGAFIATQSKMFAAFLIGAAATDLVADFNQLWKSAGTNQHRYDYYGQGRFGTNPFDDFELYKHESAVFSARTMDTPLLLFHGTDDGSVEWLQAVEFYNALRFNDKPVILCSYPGAGHHLRKLENQIDYQTRMEQFVDHYLKDKPAPDWMIHGVPHLEKKK